MTATEPAAPPAELPARLVWLNGPYSIGKRTLAEFVRDHWDVAMFDAEDWGTTLQRGLPARHDAGDLQELEVWLHSVLRLGTDLARAFRPVVVMPATIYRPKAVRHLLDRFRNAGVDVLHVVLATDEATLRARIHDRDVDAHAKRWAMQHLRPSLAGLSGIQDAVQLDATQAPEQLAQDLARVLYEHDWLTETGEWTRTGR